MELLTDVAVDGVGARWGQCQDAATAIADDGKPVIADDSSARQGERADPAAPDRKLRPGCGGKSDIGEVTNHRGCLLEGQARGLQAVPGQCRGIGRRGACTENYGRPDAVDRGVVRQENKFGDAGIDGDNRAAGVIGDGERDRADIAHQHRLTGRDLRGRWQLEQQAPHGGRDVHDAADGRAGLRVAVDRPRELRVRADRQGLVTDRGGGDRLSGKRIVVTGHFYESCAMAWRSPMRSWSSVFSAASAASNRPAQTASRASSFKNGAVCLSVPNSMALGAFWVSQFV